MYHYDNTGRLVYSYTSPHSGAVITVAVDETTLRIGDFAVSGTRVISPDFSTIVHVESVH